MTDNNERWLIWHIKEGLWNSARNDEVMTYKRDEAARYSLEIAKFILRNKNRGEWEIPKVAMVRDE